MKKSISIWLAPSLVASLLACSPGITTQGPQFSLQPAQTSLEVTPGGELELRVAGSQSRFYGHGEDASGRGGPSGGPDARMEPGFTQR